MSGEADVVGVVIVVSAVVGAIGWWVLQLVIIISKSSPPKALLSGFRPGQLTLIGAFEGSLFATSSAGAARARPRTSESEAVVSENFMLD